MLDMSVAAAGDVIEVLTNTWSYSTLGLVYDSGRGQVRYAHESQSSMHNSTVYDVDYPVPHTVMFSASLSAQNSGWPWQQDRTWCETGQVKRKRKEGVVEVQDPDAAPKKS